MQISSKLFNQQQLKQFSSTTEDLQNIQDKISSGQNILRASDDPVGSVELSGLNVVKSQIEQFERNVNSATGKLTLLDKSLENLSNTMIRVQELVIQASSDTLGASDREAIALGGPSPRTARNSSHDHRSQYFRYRASSELLRCW